MAVSIIAVSYLNQCDLPDFKANNREIFRILRPEGRFVIANLHPMRSAAGGWQRTDDGEKRHVILDRYFEEGESLEHDGRRVHELPPHALDVLPGIPRGGLYNLRNYRTISGEGASGASPGTLRRAASSELHHIRSKEGSVAVKVALVRTGEPSSTNRA